MRAVLSDGYAGIYAADAVLLVRPNLARGECLAPSVQSVGKSRVRTGPLLAGVALSDCQNSVYAGTVCVISKAGSA